MNVPNVLRPGIPLLALLLLISCGETEPGVSGDDTAAASGTHDATAAGTPNIFATEEGGFEVAFPPGLEEPQKAVNPLPGSTGAGDLTVHSTGDSTTAYLVAYNNYPDSLWEAWTEEQILDNAEKGVLAATKGTIDSRVPLDYYGHTGRAVRLHGQGHGGYSLFMRSAYYLVRPRLYQVTVIARDSARLDAPATDDYFASFSLRNTNTATGE